MAKAKKEKTSILKIEKLPDNVVNLFAPREPKETHKEIDGQYDFEATQKMNAEKKARIKELQENQNKSVIRSTRLKH